MIKMADEMDQLYNDIMSECKSKEQISQFSASVRDRLEKYDRNVRKQITSRQENNHAPLFYACEMRHVEMVEYLISICGVDVEQTGRWYGDLEMTPLQMVCFNLEDYHSDVVKCLLKHGADINRPYALLGYTCLMETMYNVELCELLLKNGADVNARHRRNNRTALHYAIQGKLLDTVKLLLDHGADVTLRSLENYDALQIACVVKAQPIFDYLVEHGSYSPGSLADANEIMGSRCFRGESQTALEYWRKAIEIRNANAVDGKPLAKTPVMPKRDCYRNASEFTSLDELNAIALDSDALKIQHILIPERIFGECHAATFDALQLIGASYANPDFRYQHCFNFWKRALEISVDNDSILWDDVADVAQGLVLALYNRVSKEQSRLADVLAIFKLLTRRLVTVQPPSEEVLAMDEKEGDGYDTTLKCIVIHLHLIHLLGNSWEVRAVVRHLVNRNPMSSRNQDTLLHLCLSSDITIECRYFGSDDACLSRCPDLEFTRFLLDCEADVNARNVDGKTPLHIAIRCPGNFSNQLVQLLLDHGAHLDTPDKSGSTPAHMLSAKPDNTVKLGNYITLRCLAARAVAQYEIQCNDLPATLNPFLDLHRPL